MAKTLIVLSSGASGSVGPPGPAGPGATPPGVFSISLSYDWIESINIEGLHPSRNGKLRLYITATPPGTMGTTVGAHLFLELPDQSGNTAARMDGTTLMDGTSTMQGSWAPSDLGKYPYVAGQQPWFVDLDVSITTATLIRVDAPSYSDQVDTPLIQFGQTGASPSATLTINPFVVGKPASGSGRTTLLVTALTSSVAAAVTVSGKLRRPISVTVDLTGLPATLPDNWGYQLQGYANGDLASAPVLTSGVFRTAGLVAAGPDGISTAHTFGPEEPTAITTITIYAVAGLVSAGSNRGSVLGQSAVGTFLQNIIVPGITASTVVTIGTTTGVTDPTAFVAALLGAALGVSSSVFDVVPLGIDRARVALLAIDTGQLANLAATAAKLGNSSVTAVAIANAAVGTAAIANAAITNALIANLAVGDANIISLNVSKLLAGTISVAVSLTAPDITVTNASFICKMNATDGFLVTGNGLTTQLNNATVLSNATGLVTYNTSGGTYPTQVSPGLLRIHETTGGTPRFDVQVDSAATVMRLRTPGGAATYSWSTAAGLILAGFSVDSSGNVAVSGLVNFNGGTSGTATAGAATLPANPVGFINVNVGGVAKKVPYYS